MPQAVFCAFAQSSRGTPGCLLQCAITNLSGSRSASVSTAALHLQAFLGDGFDPPTQAQQIFSLLLMITGTLFTAILFSNMALVFANADITAAQVKLLPLNLIYFSVVQNIATQQLSLFSYSFSAVYLEVIVGLQDIDEGRRCQNVMVNIAIFRVFLMWQHERKMDLVNVSMRYLQLPEQFQKRVRMYHEYLW